MKIPIPNPKEVRRCPECGRLIGQNMMRCSGCEQRRIRLDKDLKT